jgi:hypothetical protein
MTLFRLPTKEEIQRWLAQIRYRAWMRRMKIKVTKRQ